MNPAEISQFAPPEPESLEQTGLAESLLEQLIVKILYFRGELYGQDLSRAIGLKFSVIQDIVETLKLQYLLQVKDQLSSKEELKAPGPTKQNHLRGLPFPLRNDHAADR